MVLSNDEIVELVRAGTPNWVKTARQERRVLDVHVNGNNVADYLSQIETFENPKQLGLRKKFAMSNKFLFANLMRPADKAFSAKGGSKVYQVEGDKAEQELKKKLSNVRYGMGIRKYIRNVQANKYYSDPAGLVFFEWSGEDEERRTYPTIKSIDKIDNYLTEGRDVEWVLFSGEKREGQEGEFYRFVDDEKDVTVKKNGDEVVVLEDEGEVFVNPWGYVPALVNSDQPNANLTHSISPIDSVVELADKYLRTNSIKVIHEFLHGYPLFWMYLRKCERCKGTGEVKGDDCEKCNGTGGSFKRDVSDILWLNTPKKKDDSMIAPDVAGYVVPPLEIPEEQREELTWIWTMMLFTLWGTSHESGDNPTATAAILNVQPQNDSLEAYSEAFENVEQKMTNIIGDFYFGEFYKGCSISYGRRFLMEKADEIWKKYLDSKQKGSPQAVLTSLLVQYFESEYKNDPETFAVMMKGMRVEPVVHIGVTESKGLVSQDEHLQKVYFSDWWNSKSTLEILKTPITKLREELSKFIEDKKAAPVDE